MKITRFLPLLLAIFFTGCCNDDNDIPLPSDLKTWIPYPDGQIRNFTNSKQEKFALIAQVQDANQEVTPAKRSCSYEVERKVLHLVTTNAETIAVKLAIENRYLEFGNNAEVTFDVQNNFDEGPYGPYNPYEYLPEVTLNSHTYRNVIHYVQNPVTNPGILFQEYYFAKDAGLVAFKRRDNPEMYFQD